MMQNAKQIENHSSSGFTLLELLISLTILAVIVVIVFGALRVGVRAWEKGEKDIDARQRHRIVLDLFKRQLTSISLKKVRNAGKQPFLLKGDNTFLEFISNVSLVPGNDLGIVYVKYIVRSEDNNAHLAFYEKNLVLLEKDFDTENLDDDSFHELIFGVQSISFQYYPKPMGTDDLNWQDTWDPEVDSGFPKAVRMILKRDETTVPIYVIDLIEAELDP